MAFSGFGVNPVQSLTGASWNNSLETFQLPVNDLKKATTKGTPLRVASGASFYKGCLVTVLNGYVYPSYTDFTESNESKAIGIFTTKTSNLLPTGVFWAAEYSIPTSSADPYTYKIANSVDGSQRLAPNSSANALVCIDPQTIFSVVYNGVPIDNSAVGKYCGWLSPNARLEKQTAPSLVTQVNPIALGELSKFDGANGSSVASVTDVYDGRAFFKDSEIGVGAYLPFKIIGKLNEVGNDWGASVKLQVMFHKDTFTVAA